jgi:hypothetical protein
MRPPARSPEAGGFLFAFAAAFVTLGIHGPVSVHIGYFGLAQHFWECRSFRAALLEGPLRLHSQTVSTRHPSLSGASKATRAGSRFPAIFALQNSVRVAGSRNIGQPRPCQKYPWTRITARCFGKSRSGWHGSDDTWRRDSALLTEIILKGGLTARLKDRPLFETFWVPPWIS